MFSQSDKQQRGMTGEALITASLRKTGLWQHKLINYGFGTVFDKLVICPGGGYAIEIKLRQEPRIAYNLSSITRNERHGLEFFEKTVGEGHAYIVGIWKNKDTQRAFLIPWKDVRNDVLSGMRGSINMLEFKELESISGGFDLSCFKK